MKTKRFDALYQKVFLSFIILIGFFVVLALLYVYETVEYTSLSYKYMKLEKEYKSLVKHNQFLKYQVERLSSPSRIEKYAKIKLGMVYPEKTVYIDISPAEAEAMVSSDGKYVASP